MLLSYSIISSILLTFGYIAYRLLMAGENQHSVNRLTLQAIYGIAFLAPLIILPMILRSPSEYPAMGFIEIGELDGSAIGNDTDRGSILTLIDLKSLLSYLFMIGSMASVLYFVVGLVALWRIIYSGEKTVFATFTLILLEDSGNIAPFSWGRYIVMTRKDYEECGDMILLHEYAHLCHRHWLDLMIAYSTICLQWYNPAAWAMRKDLRALHEYQADETVMSEGIDIKEYQMLLLMKAAGYGYQSLANSLNHSKLKKRVTMMYKKKTSLKRRLFSLSLIPAIGAGIAVTSIPSVAGVIESLAETPSSVSASAPATDVKAKDREVFLEVDTNAEYPGGMTNLLGFLTKSVKYPEAAIKKQDQGRVAVRFVIERDGSISEAAIEKSVSPELDAEALRVVNAMPKWTPAKIGGKNVASQYVLPIVFRLPADTPKEKQGK